MTIDCTGAGNGGGGCNATLEVGAKDLYITEHFDYGGGHERFVTFQCISCKAETDVEDVPSAIYNRLPKKDAWRRPRRRSRPDIWDGEK